FNKVEANFAFIYPDYDNTSSITDTNPAFGASSIYSINEQSGAEQACNTARPSSNHPGTVVAGFADGGVRPLNDSISTRVYIELLQPDVTYINVDELGW
ncbi:MAG: DUF1559 domain-containing protein, partial [Planctomycetaceae bacterium]|nr:DUF1559 domain-containing protein [Planctomycetaceae bacterium]